MKKIWLAVTQLGMSMMIISCTLSPTPDLVEPIHLDDIHFIVSDEEAAVTFFKTNFGAREMAHPGDRFHLVRFLSLQWQGPTITITQTGPYADLPEDRNQRWLDAKIISPKSEKASPVYGAKWLAISTPSLNEARKQLLESGVEISEENVSLPMEPNTPAFSVYGPDHVEIVVVERPKLELGDAMYAIDHIQFLVEDVGKTQSFFEEIFAAKAVSSTAGNIELRVADARLVLSEPVALGLLQEEVSPRMAEGTIRIGLDHLGFLYGSVHDAVDAAESKGRDPIFKPQRYIYKGKPTVYTFTAFSSPEDFNIEMVQADGRIGPHSYYMDQNKWNSDSTDH